MPVIDHLPENTNWKDDGCEVAPHCLSCPLPVCRYDLPPKRAGAIQREARLRELIAAGHSVAECAALLGVARRTIFRLRQYKATASLDTLPLLTRHD